MTEKYAKGISILESLDSCFSIAENSSTFWQWGRKKQKMLKMQSSLKCSLESAINSHMKRFVFMRISEQRKAFNVFIWTQNSISDLNCHSRTSADRNLSNEFETSWMHVISSRENSRAIKANGHV